MGGFGGTFAGMRLLDQEGGRRKEREEETEEKERLQVLEVQRATAVTRIAFSLTAAPILRRCL